MAIYFIFSTIDFFEYLSHYKFEESYTVTPISRPPGVVFEFGVSGTNIMRSLLPKCEYTGLNEILPIIYILFKKGYYDWLDYIVSYIAIKNRLQRDYNINYELKL